MSELESLQLTPIDRSQNYSSWALPFLADYIVNRKKSPVTAVK
jgi:regulator of cell morphogenesis and NO signaling